jgi:hypothetical protein
VLLLVALVASKAAAEFAPFGELAVEHTIETVSAAQPFACNWPTALRTSGQLCDVQSHLQLCLWFQCAEASST